MLKKIIKKFIPSWGLNFYHKSLAILASIFYLRPSRKLIIIGVTGTKGKSTVSNMIWQILQTNGFKTGLATTANFRISEHEWINDTKMTMQGRFRLQKLLRQMVQAKCVYAVIETSSEGIKQFRHLGIDYNIAVFTNLTPEHIESHGNFENYKLAKAELFKKLKGQGTIIVNVDDQFGDFYNSFPAQKHITYSIKNDSDIKAEGIEVKENGNYFVIDNKPFYIPLRGEFNIYNVLAAVAVARSLNIDWQKIINTVAKFNYMPGRMEEIKSAVGFSVFVDYAHTPESLEAVYKTLKPDARQLIVVLGSCGGGRDKAKRPLLGALAGQYADVVIVTNEDPYDENPVTIIDEVLAGLDKYLAEHPDKKIAKHKILDRSEAIKKAISLAEEGDLVVITGKGSEQCIVTAHGKQPWDDREEVKKYI